MRGGIRAGAGRKALSKEKRKIPKNIYLKEEQVEYITQLELDGCNSFSKKCVDR